MHNQPLASLYFSVLGKKRSQCILIYFCESFMLSFHLEAFHMAKQYK